MNVTIICVPEYVNTGARAHVAKWYCQESFTLSFLNLVMVVIVLFLFAPEGAKIFWFNPPLALFPISVRQADAC